MRRPAAVALLVLLVAVAVGLGACTKKDGEPRMPSACTDAGPAAWERALARAPGAQRLPGGEAISTCAKRVLTDAELENLGTIAHTAAEHLATRATRDHDTGAATRLGFLSGAVSAGAGEYGVGAELAHRIENTTVAVAADPALDGALQRGAKAGAARG
jgi:hypothetical protein